MPTHLSCEVTQPNYVAFCDFGLSHPNVVCADMNYNVVKASQWWMHLV